jgi:hypothetical protein
MGALSWEILAGRAGEMDLAALRVVMAVRYDDDEPGSPWSFYLYLDERADNPQREALEDIFVGRLGGSAVTQFPWAWKESKLLGVRAVPIEIDHTPGKRWFRAGRSVAVRIRAPSEGSETVTCVIPGHHRSGREVDTDLIAVSESGLGFEFEGVCGYETDFAYSSADGGHA